MRFDLDAQQRAFEQTVDEYLQNECPLSRSLKPHDTSEADFDLWVGLMDLGIGGLIVPEAYGGLGLGLLDLAVVAEVLGRFAAPGPFYDHALATLAVVLGGTEEQKHRLLPLLANGELRGTIAFAEGASAWSPDTWTLCGDTRISGAKRHVLHAEGADIIVVGLAGGRLGIVEGTSAGVDIRRVASTDAGRQLADVSFVETPFEPMEASVGQRVTDAGWVLLAADAFGGASRCVDMGVEYAKLRVQFDRLIGSFQAVKHQLADMALTVQPSQGLYWYAAHAFDTEPDAASQAAAIAKSHITELYPKVARRMIEVHGGIGYTWEFGAHVWLKRALFDQAYLGMPRQLRSRIADLCDW